MYLVTSDYSAVNDYNIAIIKKIEKIRTPIFQAHHITYALFKCSALQRERERPYRLLQFINTGGSLAPLVATLVRSTKLLYAGPG